MILAICHPHFKEMLTRDPTIKDKINNFYNNRYSKDDKIYNDVIEFSCKDSSVDGEYYIFMAKDIGNIFYMRKDKIEGNIEESFSILESQTIIE